MLAVNLHVLGGLLAPFARTSLGAATVFLLKNGISQRVQRILTGFDLINKGHDVSIVAVTGAA